ncbi:unnamed protein product [Bemisia tabaci]|uniref:ATP-dependent DNA helicase n=1 Tax=Bemisia tabaci TaxID=7038 RepID=A0A9P0EZZ4_BEMTA|nr:unnamed protein product [Bemisia tabaci]
MRFSLMVQEDREKLSFKNVLLHCTKENLDVISVAWTSIVAPLLPNGRPAHSKFKIPSVLNENSVSSLTVSSREAETIRKTTIIFWGEAPMVITHALACIDRFLREWVMISLFEEKLSSRVVILDRFYPLSRMLLAKHW